MLDFKLRCLPRLKGSLAFVDRTVALLHGLYYLQGLTILAVLALLAYILASGSAPSFVTYSTGVQVGTLLAVLATADLYKQRFFLDLDSEWGLHLRTGLFARQMAVLRVGLPGGRRGARPALR